jgi:hypothetical protein
MERCHSLTFTGQVEQIVGATASSWYPHRCGESHRVIWLNTQQLSRAGIDRDTLHIGDQVTATVGTRDDVVERPMLLAAITRTSDGWEWSQVPQGC